MLRRQIDQYLCKVVTKIQGYTIQNEYLTNLLFSWMHTIMLYVTVFLLSVVLIYIVCERDALLVGKPVYRLLFIHGYIWTTLCYLYNYCIIYEEQGSVRWGLPIPGVTMYCLYLLMAIALINIFVVFIHVTKLLRLPFWTIIAFYWIMYLYTFWVAILIWLTRDHGLLMFFIQLSIGVSMLLLHLQAWDKTIDKDGKQDVERYHMWREIVYCYGAINLAISWVAIETIINSVQELWLSCHGALLIQSFLALMLLLFVKCIHFWIYVYQNRVMIGKYIWSKTKKNIFSMYDAIKGYIKKIKERWTNKPKK
jgi:hypothetical protein